METLWRIDSDGISNLDLEYDLNLKKGKLKLVLIDPLGSVMTIVEGSNKGSTSLSLNEGTYRIKIVGDSGKGEIVLKLEDNESLDIKSVD